MKNELGITGAVLRDEEPLNPCEEYDMLGTMVCRHGRYNLGHTTEDPENYEDCIHLPLYLYDHSGLTMSTESFNCPWDSGRVGTIYVTKELMKKEGLDEDQAIRILKNEVQDYDAFLRGDCWGYVVERDGEVLDSCWGFLGDADYCRKEMEESFKHRVEEDRNRIYSRDLKYTETDWIHEVTNHNMVLGLEEWRQHMEESDE